MAYSRVHSHSNRVDGNGTWRDGHAGHSKLERHHVRLKQVGVAGHPDWLLYLHLAPGALGKRLFNLVARQVLDERPLHTASHASQQRRSAVRRQLYRGIYIGLWKWWVCLRHRRLTASADSSFCTATIVGFASIHQDGSYHDTDKALHAKAADSVSVLGKELGGRLPSFPDCHLAWPGRP